MTRFGNYRLVKTLPHLYFFDNKSFRRLMFMPYFSMKGHTFLEVGSETHSIEGAKRSISLAVYSVYIYILCIHQVAKCICINSPIQIRFYQLHHIYICLLFGPACDHVICLIAAGKKNTLYVSLYLYVQICANIVISKVVQSSENTSCLHPLQANFDTSI